MKENQELLLVILDWVHTCALHTHSCDYFGLMKLTLQCEAIVKGKPIIKQLNKIICV